MGKLIVIEGLDGSGKGTQSDIVAEYFQKHTEKFMRINLPDYESDSSALVKMYLNGDFGENPMEVNPYASSMFFAADRFSSFQMNWKKQYEDGYFILANRYATSNIVHHTVKLPKSEWNNFIDWIYDFEFVKMELPKPDKVIYIDMDIEISQKFMSKRYNGDETKKDIHEKDISYLSKCREAALFAAERLSWDVVKAFDENGPLTIPQVTEKILTILK